MAHLAHPQSSINSACFVPRTNFLITGGGNDFELKLHDLSSCPITTSTFPKAHANSVNAVHTLADSGVVTSSSNDTIVLHDMQELTVLRTLNGSSADVDGLSVPREQILDCKMLNQDMVACCGVSHHLSLFDLRQRSKRPVYSLSLGDDNLNSMDYDASQTIVVGSSNGKLYNLDIRKEVVLTDSLPNHNSVVHVACYGPRSNLVSFADGGISLYDPQLRTMTAEIRTLDYGSQLTYKRNAQYVESHDVVLCGNEEGDVRIWNLVHGKVGRSSRKSMDHLATGKGRPVTWTGYDENTNRLVGTTGNGYLYLWDRAM